MTDALAELLLRYELGDFEPRVRHRLAEIFATNPPDALERLARAAEYLGITSVTPETFARADRGLTSPSSSKAAAGGTVERSDPVPRRD